MSLPPNSTTDAANLAFAKGSEAQAAGNLELAKQSWRWAIQLDPHHTLALYNLAVALNLTKEDGAEALYEKIIAIDPAHRDAIYNLANARKLKDDVEGAKLLYRRLIDAYPAFAAPYINLAKCYSDNGDWEEAEKLLRRALEIDPRHTFAHWNLSHILLRRGQWAEGWREYEYRLQLPGWLSPPVDAPAWNDEVKARRIVLWNDQGIGDAIQFLRYVKILADRGHEVWVLVQENLKDIAATAPGVTEAVGPGDVLPHFDAQAPLLSMPYRLGVSDVVPQPRPYLTATKLMTTPRRAHSYSAGLVWAGNGNHKNNFSRSVTLADLKPLFDLPHIDWFSLQFGEPATQINENNLLDKIHDLAPGLNNFADTASAIASLDLVISIDTSVAHLAGAMGKECWLMLPYLPEWRWAGQGETTPWYPSLRLFRQQKPGDWQGVVDRVMKALAVQAQRPNL